MKKKLSLFFCGLILLGLFSGFISPTTAAVPGDILKSGDVVSGTLDRDNPRDLFGLDIVDPGVYNVSIYSTGSIAVGYTIYENSLGLSGTPILSDTANDSATWEIKPGTASGSTGLYG